MMFLARYAMAPFSLGLICRWLACSVDQLDGPRPEVGIASTGGALDPVPHDLREPARARAAAAAGGEQDERAGRAGLAERQGRFVARAEAGAAGVALELGVLDVDPDRRDVLRAPHEACPGSGFRADRDRVDSEELREDAVRAAV